MYLHTTGLTPHQTSVDTWEVIHKLQSSDGQRGRQSTEEEHLCVWDIQGWWCPVW